jgi:3-phytase
VAADHASRPAPTTTGVDRPNNVDVAYGVRIGNRKVDVAVVTERNKQQLRVFEIVPGEGLRDLAALPVFEGERGPAALPMGIAMYRRKRDRALFAIVSRKTGPSGSYLWQYEIRDNGRGGLEGKKIREFGIFSGTKEIEAVAVDADREHVYYADEGAGIRKYPADPAHPEASRKLALFGQAGWKGDREGLAIHDGFIVATDQQHPNSEFHVFSRDTLREVGIFRIGADTTDGIEIAPFGLFVAMNDSRHNFILVDWKAIATGLRLRR